MKINANCVLKGSKAVLVPYESKHVERYHQWMMSPELQQLTASEPLSLEDEYKMQKSWRDDDDKCTFIVLDSARLQETRSEMDSMAGDVNLFFNNADDCHCAEVEVMIAETSSRGRGLGKESVHLMMAYGISQLAVTTFTAKISLQNTASLSLFEKLGFKEVSHSDVFEEVALCLHTTPAVQEAIATATSMTVTLKYSEWLDGYQERKDSQTEKS